MSKDLNLCQFIGRLGKDPEVKHTNSGQTVASFSIAVGDDYTKDGQKVEQTEWVRCVAWGKLAEICGKWLSKGSQVYIGGKMKTRKWQDQSGQDRYTTEVVVNDMQMLGGKQDAAQQRPAQQQKPAQPTGDFGDDFMDDDIPF